MAPLIGADSNAAKARRGDAQKQPADKLLPVESFDTTRWRKMDADVRFTGNRIVRKSNLPVSNLSAHLLMDDGMLTLDPVALSAASGQTVTVNYSVTGGNATGGGVDYTLANGTLTFTPGQTSKNIGMSIVNDAIDEGSFENVIITLSAPGNATLGTIIEHTLKILDDD